jgi:hypothetical protein
LMIVWLSNPPRSNAEPVTVVVGVGVPRTSPRVKTCPPWPVMTGVVGAVGAVGVVPPPVTERLISPAVPGKFKPPATTPPITPSWAPSAISCPMSASVTFSSPLTEPVIPMFVPVPSVVSVANSLPIVFARLLNAVAVDTVASPASSVNDLRIIVCVAGSPPATLFTPKVVKAPFRSAFAPDLRAA